jgi:hypothetical protein
VEASFREEEGLDMKDERIVGFHSSTEEILLKWHYVLSKKGDILFAYQTLIKDIVPKVKIDKVIVEYRLEEED